MEHLVLAAAAEGLGTCWVAGRLEEAAVKSPLGIPDHLRVVALTPLGFPAEEASGSAAEASSRKPMDEIAFRNRYGTPLPPFGK
jgi:nitroreductase